MKKTNKYNSILKDINKRFENKNFEYILSNLTLEELVTAKLEFKCKLSLNGKLYRLSNLQKHTTYSKRIISQVFSKDSVIHKKKQQTY